MAIVNMPERDGRPMNGPVDRQMAYNDRLQPIEPVNTKPVPKSAVRKWLDDIWYGLNEEIIKPTLKNLLYQLITTGSRSAIYGPSGGPSGNGGYSGGNYYNDYRAASNAPQGGRDRFNSNDRFGGSNGYSQRGEYITANNWRTACGFSDQASAEMALRRLKDRCYQRRYVTVGDYCDISGKQNFDWTLDHYGWRNIDNAYVKYEMFGDQRRPFHIILPYEEYLGD